MTGEVPEVTGDCATCGEPKIWGGMSWVEHSDAYHVMVRRRLLKFLHLILVGKVAKKRDHIVTIRFTPGYAWFECLCGEQGYVWTDSGQARSQAHSHLYTEGTES